MTGVSGISRSAVRIRFGECKNLWKFKMPFTPKARYEKMPHIIPVFLSLSPKEGGPVGNFGIGNISDFLYASFFGYSEQAAPLLPLGNERIDRGLEGDEPEWFLGVPRYHYLRARGLGRWLANNEQDQCSFNEARRFQEEHWRTASLTRQEVVDDELDEYLPLCVLGGVKEDSKCGQMPFEAGIDLYEYYIKKEQPSLKKVLKPREFGYLLCRHYLNNEFDRSEVLEAGRRMLAKNLANAWFDRGQYIRAAIWLMIIHWYPALHFGEALPTPVRALLQGWEDMPGIQKPF